MNKMSNIERSLRTQMIQIRLPRMEHDYRFAAYLVGLGPGVRARLKAAGLRDWRFDFADIDRKIAIECEGGTWSGGRHTRGGGYEGDCEKYNHAQRLGWKVYRFTSAMISDGRAVFFLEQIYADAQSA